MIFQCIGCLLNSVFCCLAEAACWWQAWIGEAGLDQQPPLLSPTLRIWVAGSRLEGLPPCLAPSCETLPWAIPSSPYPLLLLIITTGMSHSLWSALWPTAINKEMAWTDIRNTKSFFAIIFLYSLYILDTCCSRSNCKQIGQSSISLGFFCQICSSSQEYISYFERKTFK